ncbi:Uncharacterised protein [Escherichia coli]|nr:Uncharacterised protein [Escherichia coli]
MLACFIETGTQYREADQRGHETACIVHHFWCGRDNQQSAYRGDANGVEQNTYRATFGWAGITHTQAQRQIAEAIIRHANQ